MCTPRDTVESERAAARALSASENIVGVVVAAGCEVEVSVDG